MNHIPLGPSHADANKKPAERDQRGVYTREHLLLFASLIAYNINKGGWVGLNAIIYTRGEDQEAKERERERERRC
jgi:hypothetical protein